jgi:glycosyltransferase involved in cell wall biosynthesis
MFEKLESNTIESAAAVITICPELHDYVADLFPAKHNVLIENVADNSMVFDGNVDRSTIRDRVKKNGDISVLYAGTFEPYQGIDLLIESSRSVIAENQDVRFIMVGGKPEQVDFYRAKVSELKLQDNYLFTGSVSPEEVPAYIEACDVLVSPRIEGNNTPLKIYSYLRSGKPIVATKHLTHTQVLNDEVSVLTECTPEAFGDGVLSVVQDQAYGKKIAEKAADLAEQKYSYNVYLDKTRKLFEFLQSRITD